jgi:uncharacterized protein YndB with AHSA1/START domain
VTDAEATTVEQEIRIEAPPEDVFPYFTEAAKVTRWMGIDCKLDPSPGGSFRIDVNGTNVAGGQFVVVEPPRRLVLTWGWEGSDEMPPGSTTVEVRLTPDGDATVVHLSHRDLPAAQVEPHAEGWAHYLAQLGLAAASGS